MTKSCSKRGFTLIELMITMAILAILSTVATMTLNPAEILKRARDARRLSDTAALTNAINYVAARAGFLGRDMDWDGPNYPDDSCVGQPNQRVFISLPSGGEPVPDPPPGWTWAQVTSSTVRNIDGMEAQNLLEQAGIIANRNTVPGDPSPFKPFGIRLGTPVVTTRGLRENEMILIADWFDHLLTNKAAPAIVKEEVTRLCRTFSLEY